MRKADALFGDQMKGVGYIWRNILMRMRCRFPVTYAELTSDLLPTSACTDLGAFRQPLQPLRGLKSIILMEDRAPEFFLSYASYEADRIVPLNRHGPLREVWHQAELRELIRQAHAQGVKVLIGFWGFWGDQSVGPTEWLKRHPELRPRRPDESDIGDPFAMLRPEDVSFAEYVAAQYCKLQRDFGFDGLFLGDGLMGFRAFVDPGRYADRADACGAWAEFYLVIAAAVHQGGGELWAYDCMGLSADEARNHGVDYALLSCVGLDVLVFQSYPTAWVEYFRVPTKIGLEQDVTHLHSMYQALVGRRTRILYTAELGDSWEGWWPSRHTARKQMIALRPLVDGKFLVWGNDMISRF